MQEALDESDEEGEIKDSPVGSPAPEPATSAKEADATAVSLWQDEYAAMLQEQAHLKQHVLELQAQLAERNHDQPAGFPEFECRWQSAVEGIEMQSVELQLQHRADCAKESDEFKEKCRQVLAHERQARAVEMQLEVAKAREQENEGVQCRLDLLRQQKDEELHNLREQKDEEMQMQLDRVTKSKDAEMQQQLKEIQQAADAELEAYNAQREAFEKFRQLQDEELARVKESAVAELAQAHEKSDEAIAACKGAAKLWVAAVEALCRELCKEKREALKEVAELRDFIKKRIENQGSISVQTIPTTPALEQPAVRLQQAAATAAEGNKSENQGSASGSSQVQEEALCSNRENNPEHRNEGDAALKLADTHDMPSAEGVQHSSECQKRKQQRDQGDQGPAKRPCSGTNTLIYVSQGDTAAAAGPSQPELMQQPAQDREQVQPNEACHNMRDLVAQLTSCWSGKAINLSGKVIFAPTESSVGAESWRQCHFWPQVKSAESLEGDVLGPLPPENAPEARIVVLSAQYGTRIEGGSTSFTSGSIELGKHGVLVLNQSCHGVRIEDLNFHGGLVVCSGPGCEVDFAHVTFYNSTVVVTSGAEVSLKACTFTQKDVLVSVASSGSGTIVKLGLSTITGGHHGVQTLAGSSLEVKSLHVGTLSGAAAVCSDRSSHIRLSNCVFTSCVRGVMVKDAGGVTLASCKISRARVGVRVKGSTSSCTMSDVAINHPTARGVEVSDGGILRATQCSSVSEHTEGDVTAYLVQDKGSFVDLAACSVNGHNSGLILKQKCKAKMCHITVEGCAEPGVNVLEGAGAQLDNCTLCSLHSRGKGSQVVMHGCTMKHSIAQGSSEECLAVSKAASAVLSKCSFFGEHYIPPNTKRRSTAVNRRSTAIKVTGAAVQLQAKTVTINRGFSFGLHVAHSRQTTLESCRILECSHDAVTVQNPSAKVSMVKCCIEMARGIGLSMLNGAKVELSQCAILECQKGGVIVNGDGARFVAKQCSIESNEKGGVLATCKVEIELTDCKLHRNKDFAFRDSRKGVVPVRLGVSSLLPDAVPRPKLKNMNICKAAQEYVWSLAAELHAHGPCDVKHLQAVPKAITVMKLEKILAQFDWFYRDDAGQIHLKNR